LQAAYEKGAFGYIAGNNFANGYGSVSQNRFPGAGFVSEPYIAGWNPQINSDCVFTGSGACEQQWGWDITGAYKHYWFPILSSAVYGSYLEVHYPANALNGFGGAVGVSNLKETRIGTNLVWTPLKGFDIGAEFIYVHLNQTRPAGLAPDFGPASLTATGLPAFQPNTTTRAACASSAPSNDSLARNQSSAARCFSSCGRLVCHAAYGIIAAQSAKRLPAPHTYCAAHES